MNYIEENFPFFSDTIFSVTFAIVIVIIVNVAIRQLAFIRMPRAYSIAVVGYPRSGKTFLITAIFGELFSGRLFNTKIVPRGKETIERINRDLEALEIGRSLGPTTDQDLFAYRADITRGTFPIARKYKVEIGDFPGEDTEEFAEQFGDWFHDTEYFKWVMEANAFIFVVDIVPLLDKNKTEYVARVTRGIRAAWQHLVEYHVEGKKDITRKPICLAFTKADILMRYPDSYPTNGNNEKLMKLKELGLDKIVPINLDKEPYTLDDDIVKGVASDFSDLIRYFNNQSRNFNIVFVSAIANSEKGRFGVRELLRDILPN